MGADAAGGAAVGQLPRQPARGDGAAPAVSPVGGRALSQGRARHRRAADGGHALAALAGDRDQPDHRAGVDAQAHGGGGAQRAVLQPRAARHRSLRRRRRSRFRRSWSRASRICGARCRRSWPRSTPRCPRSRRPALAFSVWPRSRRTRPPPPDAGARRSGCPGQDQTGIAVGSSSASALLGARRRVQHGQNDRVMVQQQRSCAKVVGCVLLAGALALPFGGGLQSHAVELGVGSGTPMLASPRVPAAQGAVSVKDADNGNVKLEVSVKHMAPPERVATGALQLRGLVEAARDRQRERGAAEPGRARGEQGSGRRAQHGDVVPPVRSSS